MLDTEGELRLAALERKTLKQDKELNALRLEVENQNKKLEALTARLLDHEIGEKEIEVRSEAPYKDRAWVLPPKESAEWELIHEHRRRIRNSVVRAGLVPTQQPGETEEAFSRRVLAYCEDHIKTNKEFRAYVDAANRRDPWAWAEGLEALAEPIDGELSQFVAIVKRSWKRGTSLQGQPREAAAS